MKFSKNRYEGENCDSCIASTHYKNNDGHCATLPTGCATANSDGLCTTCDLANRFYMKNEGTCTPMPTYCKEMTGYGCLSNDNVKLYHFNNLFGYSEVYISERRQLNSGCGDGTVAINKCKSMGNGSLANASQIATIKSSYPVVGLESSYYWVGQNSIANFNNNGSVDSCPAGYNGSGYVCIIKANQ